jgi:CHAD domain-containing protein
MSALRNRHDLLKKRLDVFTRMLHGVERGEVRALHRTRVASRRLRELLPLLQLDRDLTRKLTRRLKRVTEGLGAVRELDVLNMLLEELHESGRYRNGGLGQITAAVARDRDEARKRLESKLPVGELHRVAGKLAEVAAGLESYGRSNRRHERAWRWAIDARIARRAEKLTGAMREAGAVYLAERLHVVRISLKKFRYAVELFVEAAGEKTSADLRTLKHGQEILGQLHDRQVLIDRVRQLQAADGADAKTERELEDIVYTLEDDCRRLHARYVRDRAALADICGRSSAAAIGIGRAQTARRSMAARIARRLAS